MEFTAETGWNPVLWKKKDWRYTSTPTGLLSTVGLLRTQKCMKEKCGFRRSLNFVKYSIVVEPSQPHRITASFAESWTGIIGCFGLAANSEVAKLPISAVLKYWLILQLIDLRIPCYSFLFWFLHFEKGKWEVYDFATLYVSHELKIRRSTTHLFARFLRRRASYQPNALKPEQGGTMTALTVKRVDPPAALAPQCWTSWGSGSTSAEIRGLKAGRRSWVEYRSTFLIMNPIPILVEQPLPL